MNTVDKKGFTIIEVVLVLAIAGLIFLIVFLALPALQKAQRDTQRKNDLSRFMSQLTQYQSNHQGQLPTGTGANAWDANFISPYLGTGAGESFNDPTTGNQYVSSVSATIPGTIPTTLGTISIYTSANCQSGIPTATGNGRSVAVTMPLEKGGYLCQNN